MEASSKMERAIARWMIREVPMQAVHQTAARTFHWIVAPAALLKKPESPIKIAALLRRMVVQAPRKTPAQVYPRTHQALPQSVSMIVIAGTQASAK